MGAVCGGGQQGTGHFVLTLGPAFKTLDAVGNAPFNGLVITGFKVQAVHPRERPPVTAIGHFGLASGVQVQAN